MHKFVRSFITEWRLLELPFADSTVVAAVSGGADSVSLLLALAELKRLKKLNHRIVAAHFNHRLRDGASDADEAFVRELATRLGVELAVSKASLPSDGNLEQNARKARYQFLHSTAKNLNAFAVLTGHTLNDQAETVLMNLIRGSGPDGLAGMRSVRRLDVGLTIDPKPDSPSLPLDPLPIKLVRPLLTWAKRSDTEAFCHHLGVDYRYDTMNEDTAFKRVRIRKVLLPLLEDFNPRIVESLGNTARLMQHLANGSFGNQTTPSDELTIAELKGSSKDEIYEKIRSWLKHRRGTTRQLELKHIQSIERLVFSKRSGRTIEIPGATVSKRGGTLVYEENKVDN